MFTFEQKWDALRTLQTRVVVGRSGVKLSGVIPSFYAPPAQTSGCWFDRRAIERTNPESLVFIEVVSDSLMPFRRHLVPAFSGI